MTGITRSNGPAAVPTPPDATEIGVKLEFLRGALLEHGLAAIRLRGHAWFAWATGGASNSIILTSELGVAELVVTLDGAWVVTDSIESERLESEEIRGGLPIADAPWNRPEERERFVLEKVGDGRIASDAPSGWEVHLPSGLLGARRRLLAPEIERYRALGRDAASAVTEVLHRARPEWTEQRLAGAAAAALWQRGIHPAVVLVAGARRLPRFRHPTPSQELLRDRAMLVICARRHGLYANLTRFVSFRRPTDEEVARERAVAQVEAAAWKASVAGATLGDVYAVIVGAYAAAGFRGADGYHHQGGTTGYQSREVIALPGSSTVIEPWTAVAWNPSLPGAKIEDTALVGPEGIEVLTIDPAWPTFEVDGRQRPDVLALD